MENESNSLERDRHLRSRIAYLSMHRPIETRRARQIQKLLGPMKITPSRNGRSIALDHSRDSPNRPYHSRIHNAILIASIGGAQNRIIWAISEFGLLHALDGWPSRMTSTRSEYGHSAVPQTLQRDFRNTCARINGPKPM
jgi:hypothetical protein